MVSFLPPLYWLSFRPYHLIFPTVSRNSLSRATQSHSSMVVESRSCSPNLRMAVGR